MFNLFCYIICTYMLRDMRVKRGGQMYYWEAGVYMHEEGWGGGGVNGWGMRFLGRSIKGAIYPFSIVLCQYILFHLLQELDLKSFILRFKFFYYLVFNGQNFHHEQSKRVQDNTIYSFLFNYFFYLHRFNGPCLVL